MPWKIIKLAKDKFQLEKIEDGTRPNKIFKTRESAISMGKRWMEYRKAEMTPDKRVHGHTRVLMELSA